MALQIYTNHIGYEYSRPKKAVLRLDAYSDKPKIWLIDTKGIEMEVEFVGPTNIEHWSEDDYYSIDFSIIEQPGTYWLKAVSGNVKCIREIQIMDYVLPLRMVNTARAHLKGERSSGEWQKADKELTFQGDKAGKVDLHGGWYDATGDFGIHLTQLSHTGVFNPVQSVLPAYVAFCTVEQIRNRSSKDCRILEKELLDEAYWGADYCRRLSVPNSGFYRSVDRGEAFTDEQHRKIDYEYFHYTGHEEDKSYLAEKIEDKNYQVGLRSGAGICIAVLAQAARFGCKSGEVSEEEYLSLAQSKYAYYQLNNKEHLSDKKENFLDAYEALCCAVELYKSTGQQNYLNDCRNYYRKIESYIVKMKNGIWFTSMDNEMYFHPSDEGLPLIAMIKYLELEEDKELCKKVEQTIKQAMLHVLSVSKTPFGYAGFTYKKIGDTEVNRYFFPHDTKASPWWQGENARIASLATAMLLASAIFKEEEFGKRIVDFAVSQLNWIMGLNPFDSCMIEGFGRNNIQYFYKGQYDFLNSPGGICNGITSRESDDLGIEFIMEPCSTCDDNWRWAEQWLPHVSWFLFAWGCLLKSEG
ncbi:glycoside hydrolase family 9 protein [Anaerocolumna aminovalerica]|uniref:glycoside hydrolase family 9 protein n=1 Tax=Anaerocolumna aminovalerica TaxID=1527 RepID=UPI000BE25122|nr:glycoside hydrolase family 9 protein [Anaerocolumna aminovalerica]